MNTYVVRRRQGWQSPDELKAAAERSRAIADSDFPDDIRWIRSYVVAEADGGLGTVCIYQATSPGAVRAHADQVGMPATEILDVADTVVVRPDPTETPSAA